MFEILGMCSFCVWSVYKLGIEIFYVFDAVFLYTVVGIGENFIFMAGNKNWKTMCFGDTFARLLF